MAGITFDDLVEKKSGALSFDDLTPQGDAGGVGRAVAYGVSGGQIPFGNVITSGLGAVGAKLFGGDATDNMSVGQLYDQAQADTKATQEAHPTATNIGNVLGIISTLPAAISKPVGGAGLIATPAKGLKAYADFSAKMAGATPFKGGGLSSAIGNTIARSAGGAAVTAPVVGLYSAGNAESGQRGDAFLEGAGNGAAIGAALPVAGAVLGAVAKPVISAAENAIAKRALSTAMAGAPIADDVSNAAMKKVIARLQADFPDPNDFNKAIQDFTYGNKSLAELSGERTINLAKGAAQYPTGEAVTKEKLLPLIGDAPENMKASLSRNISKKTDYYSTLDDILEQGRAKASPLYEEAYKFNKSVASKEIDNILATPAGKKALSDARIIMQNDRSLMGLPDKELGDLAKELQQMGMMAETQGGVASGLKLRTLDYVKKALDDQYQTAIRAGEKSNASAILGLKKSLVDQLDTADKTGLYAKARETAGDYLSSEKAMEAGTAFKKLDAPLIERQFAKYTPAEKNAFKVGVVKSIRDDIDQIQEGGNVYQRVFGKPERQKQLKAILGNDYLKLEKDLLAQDKLYKIRNEVLAGSPTASKQIAAQEFDNELAGFAVDVTTGGTTQALVRKATSYIMRKFDGLSDKTAGEVSRILFEKDPKEKVKLINLMKKSALLPAEKEKVLKTYFSLSDRLSNMKKQMTMPATKVNQSLGKAKQFAKDYIADESGALKILPDDYYKNPKKLTDKLSNYLDANNVEYSVEKAGTGSSYFTIHPKEGGQKTVRISDHNNQALSSHKDSYDFQIYPEKGGFSGGSSVESVIEKLGLTNKPKITRVTIPKITKETLIERYGMGNNAFNPKTEENAINRIKEDLKYSDSLFKDMYKADKETIKKIMGIK